MATIPTYFRQDGWVKSVLGQAVSGAMIYVLNQPANTVAPVNTKGVPQPFVPNPQQQIYSDPFGLSPITQPVYTDGFGHYDFYVAPGTYTIAIYVGSIVSPFAVYPDQTVGLASIAGVTFPQSITKQTSEWLDSYSAATGLFTQSQPVASDIAGLSSVTVSSLNSLTGAVSITAGSNITVMVSGSSIQISSTASGGVTSLNTLTGALSITAGSGISVMASGSSIQVSATGGSSAFNSITSGTNTAAAMVVGSGATLEVTGSGIIQATQIQAVVVSASAPSAGQVLTATSATAANWQTPSSSGGPTDDSIQSLPLLSSLTWVNQGASTALQRTANGPIFMTVADSSSLNWRLLVQNTPSTPYKTKFKSRAFILGGGFANSQTMGFYFYDGTKLLGAEFLLQAGGCGLRVERITNVNTDGSTVFSPTQTGTITNNQVISSQYASPFEDLWVQLRNDGTTLYFDFSWDGANFINVYTESVGTFITPTMIGIGGVSITSGGRAGIINSCTSWQMFSNANI